MTEAEQQIFFAILRAAAWQKEIDTSILRHISTSHLEKGSGVAISRNVIEALGKHELIPFVADAVMSLPEDLLPSFDIQQYIKRCVSANVRCQYRLNTVICELFSKLKSAGFHPVLLKGQGLSQIYPIQYVRSCGDVDIFIGKQNFWQACDLVNEYCNPHSSSNSELGNSQEELTIHWSVMKDDIDIEVHQVAADTAIPSIKKEYNEWAEQQLKSYNDHFYISSDSHEVIPLDHSTSFSLDHLCEIATPPALFNCIYVFEHLLKHLRVEGVGFRQFIDWMIVLDRAVNTGECNLSWLHDILVRFHLLDAWQVLGGILVWQLGMDKSHFPFWNERKARYSQGRNLQYIIDAGNLGHGTAESKGYYFMAPSLHRDLLALRYYWRHILFEYHVFPYDTIHRTVRRIWEKL